MTYETIEIVFKEYYYIRNTRYYNNIKMILRYKYNSKNCQWRQLAVQKKI